MQPTITRSHLTTAGPGDRARRPTTTTSARDGLHRRDRSPAGGHRAGGRRGRRGARRVFARPRPAWSSPSAAAATAAPGTAPPRAASCSICRDMQALDIDVDGRTAWAEPGLTAAEYIGGGRGARPRDRLRRLRLGRDRRHHARRRRRVPVTQVRPHDRRPARRRRRHGRRPAPPRGRRARAGSVLGDPRRRRQLRGRDPVPVPAASGRHGGGRHAVPAGARRVDRRVHRRGGGRAPRSCRRSRT